MIRDILAMIAIQTPEGMVFGTARKLDGMTLVCEVDAEVAPGTLVEWRMELPGLDDTALGKMRVIGIRKDAGMAVKIWSGNIVSIDLEDEAIFQIWRRGVEDGTRSFSHSRRPPGNDWLSNQMMAGTTPAERQRAMAVQEERRKRRVQNAQMLAKNAKKWPDPEDRAGGASVASGMFRQSLSSTSTSRLVGGAASTSRLGVAPPPVTDPRDHVVERPRQAVADALRTHLRKVVPAAPEPEPLEDDDSEPSVISMEFGSTIQPEPSPGGPLPEAASPGRTAGPDPASFADPWASAPPAATEMPTPSDDPWAPGGAVPAHEPTVPAAPSAGAVPHVAPSAASEPEPEPAAGAPAPEPPAAPPAPEAAAPPSPEPPIAASAGPRLAEGAPPDPAVHVDRGMVSLMFSDRDNYRSILRSDLLAGCIVVPVVSLGSPGGRVQLFVRTPAGGFVSLTASILGGGEDGTALEFEVDPNSAKLLELG